MKKLTVLALTLTVATAAMAQMPARGKASATVGGKAVSIDFGQAKLGARSLDEMMKGLPADGVWRAGRDQVTTITTEGPITIGGKAVPAGKYSLYVPVGKDGSYSLAVNKHLGRAFEVDLRRRLRGHGERALAGPAGLQTRRSARTKLSAWPSCPARMPLPWIRSRSRSPRKARARLSPSPGATRASPPRSPPRSSTPRFGSTLAGPFEARHFVWARGAREALAEWPPSPS